MKVDRRRTQLKKGDSRFATKPKDVDCRRCGTRYTRTAPSQIHCSAMCRLLANIKVVPSGCWEWQRATVRGYGCITIDRSWEYTHRLSWSLHNRSLANGEGVIMHKCDNRLCCNPEHLEFGTQAANLADMAKKGRAGNLGRVMPEEVRRKISATKLSRRSAS